jgi:hypothetical protein
VTEPTIPTVDFSKFTPGLTGRQNDPDVKGKCAEFAFKRLLLTVISERIGYPEEGEYASSMKSFANNIGEFHPDYVRVKRINGVFVVLDKDEDEGRVDMTAHARVDQFLKEALEWLTVELRTANIDPMVILNGVLARIFPSAL